MRLAIIAAGEGSRLKSEGISTPKPLIKINGIPMIDRIIKITAGDITGVVCLLNDNSASLREYLLNNNYKIPVNVFTKTTPSSLHSLYEMRNYLGKTFLLTTADTVFSEMEYRTFIDYANSHSDFDVLLSVTGTFEDDKPLCVEFDDQYKIVSFHNERADHKWATGGLYYFRRDIKAELENAVNSGVFRLRNFFGMLLDKGLTLKAFKFSTIIDVDHIEDIKQAEEFLKNIHE